MNISYCDIIHGFVKSGFQLIPAKLGQTPQKIWLFAKDETDAYKTPANVTAVLWFAWSVLPWNGYKLPAWVVSNMHDGILE